MQHEENVDLLERERDVREDESRSKRLFNIGRSGSGSSPFSFASLKIRAKGRPRGGDSGNRAGTSGAKGGGTQPAGNRPKVP